jgi:hypothetical protein
VRGGYRYVRPTATAPHLDSTQSCLSREFRRRSAHRPQAACVRSPSVGFCQRGDIRHGPADDARQCRAGACPAHLWCEACQHQVEPDPAEMAARYGPDTPVPEWPELLACSKCGNRDTDLVVAGTPRLDESEVSAAARARRNYLLRRQEFRFDFMKLVTMGFIRLVALPGCVQKNTTSRKPRTQVRARSIPTIARTFDRGKGEAICPGI